MVVKRVEHDLTRIILNNVLATTKDGPLVFAGRYQKQTKIAYKFLSSHPRVGVGLLGLREPRQSECVG